MARAVFVIAFAATLAVLSESANIGGSYCNIQTCDMPPDTSMTDHTLCRFGVARTAKACGKVTSSQLSRAEIKELLDAHNQLRAKVANGEETRGNPGPQPAATNIGDLKWDDEIAAVAQTWANQCAYGHDKCRDIKRFQVGQNIAYRGTTGPFAATMTQMVTDWYNEVKLFDSRQVSSVQDFEGVGHYTQVVWADTKLLGCGAVRYNADGKWNKTYLVCNYGPTGNWEGGEMYKTR